MKNEDIITKTFVSAENYLPMLINIFVKEQKGYVVIYQTPVMKTLFGLHQTTITMKKIK